MTIISLKLYEALKKAGVDDITSKEASQEVAEATKIVLEQKNDITELKAEFKSLQREVRLVGGVIISLLVAIIVALLVK